MAGSVIDLSAYEAILPRRIIVDAPLIIARFLRAAYSPLPFETARAARFFRLLASQNGVGLVTPTIANEVFHFALRMRYRLEVPNHQAELIAHYSQPPGRRQSRKFDWTDLYKINPRIARDFADELRVLRGFMLDADLLFLQPNDLGPLPFGSSLEEELIGLIERYGLDTNDAAILLESKRADVSAIVTLDHDLQRARADFDIYTWLDG